MARGNFRYESSHFRPVGRLRASWSQVGAVGRRLGLPCPDGNFWRKSSHMTIPHYWNPQQVERFLDSLAALGHRRARVAALIMWRSGLRVGETVALEWRDIDVTAGTLLVGRGKGGRGRTVPLHPDLASPVRQLARVLRSARSRLSD